MSKLLSILLVVFALSAKETTKGKGNTKSKVLNTSTTIHANNVEAIIANNGWLFWGGGPSGFVTPSPAFGGNSINAATVFASGLWLAGRIDGSLHAAIGNYAVDWSPGLIDEYVADSIANGQEKAEYKVYYYFKPSHVTFLQNLLATTTDPAVEAYANEQLALASAGDWATAVAQGAPANPPGDVALFCVYHDRNIGVRDDNGLNDDTRPMNIQVRQLAWAFYNPGSPIHNTVFIRFEFINKGSSPITDMYATAWSDPDVGDYLDDYVGSDKSLGLGYAYNGNPTDAIYTDVLGLAPPAVGYDFLQGPIVDADTNSTYTQIIQRENQETGFVIYKNFVDPSEYNPETDVIIDGKEVLPATSFFYFNNGDEAEIPEEYHFYMQGLGKDGNITSEQQTAVDDGLTSVEDATWFYNGDPDRRTGWIETVVPSDRRFMLNSGPFELGVSDGSEQFGDPGYQSMVFGAFSSFGASNRQSVTILRFEDAAIQKAFNDAFDVLPPPPAPQVSVQQQDQAFTFSWTPGTATIRGNTVTTENYNFDGYQFEGYQLVQFSNAANANSNNFKLVALWDRVNGVTAVKDQVIDLETGDVVEKTVINGINTGIVHDVRIEEDQFGSDANLTIFNNKPYYFGIRAFAVKSGTLQQGETRVKFGAWASGLANIVPQAESISNEVNATYGQTLTVDRSQSDGGDGLFIARVVNPYELTGANYSATFDTLRSDVYVPGYDEYSTDGTDTLRAGEIVWYLNKNGTQVAGPLPQAFDGHESLAQTVTVDGIAFTMTGAVLDWKYWEVTANAAGAVDPPSAAAATYNGFPLTSQGGGTETMGSQQTTGARWFLHTGGNGSRPAYTDFLTRSMRSGWDYVVPNDYEIRIVDDVDSTSTWTQFGVDRFGIGTGNVSIPFEVWDVTSNTKLAIAVIDWASDGFNYDTNPDGTGIDHEGSSANNDPQTDWFYVYTPQTTYQDYVDGVSDVDHEIWARMVFVNWNGGEASDPTFPANINALLPEQGTIFKLATNKPNKVTSTYTVTSPAAPTLNSNALASKNRDKIQVVPNPYYGAHELEDTSNKYVKFVNMPTSANTSDAQNNTTIRIFALNGDLVRTLTHNSVASEARWQLNNDEGVTVGSGFYIAHIELPDGSTKVLKLLVFIGKQQLNTF